MSCQYFHLKNCFIHPELTSTVRPCCMKRAAGTHTMLTSRDQINRLHIQSNRRRVDAAGRA